MSESAPSEIEQLMRGLTLEHVQLYHLFQKTGSLQAIGKAVNLSPNTVRSRMVTASRLFGQVFGHELFVNEHGRYGLTVHGEAVAGVYPRLTDWMAALIDEHRSMRHVYEVPCSSGALGELAALRRELPADRDFDLRPRPVRTSELQIYRDEWRSDERAAEPFALGPLLLSAEQCDDYRNSDTAHVFDNVEVVTIRDEPLFMLGTNDIELTNPTDVGTVLAQRVVIMIPPGGPVWRFMQENASDWQVKRPSQYIRIPHLEHGLATLRHRLVDRGAMILHGRRTQFEKDIPGTRSWALNEPGGMCHPSGRQRRASARRDRRLE